MKRSGLEFLDSSSPRPYAPLRVGRSRPHITRLSIADAGSEDTVTPLLEPDILDRGIIINHELSIKMRPEVYAAARLAPLSIYHGHPHFGAGVHPPDHLRTQEFASFVRNYESQENPFGRNFGMGVPQAIRSVATGIVDKASLNFRDGAAEVKIRLSSEDMRRCTHLVKLMATVNHMMGATYVGARDQVLAARFDLNTPITDDISGRPRLIRNPVSVARVSLEMMKEVASLSRQWKVPNWWRKWALNVSFPQGRNPVSLLELLGGLRCDGPGGVKRSPYSQSQRGNALARGAKVLVGMSTEAHEAGFDAYISGGMLGEETKWATYAGVDGVGLGVVVDEDALTSRSIIEGASADRIREALDIRDLAEASPLGKGARKLHQLSFAKSRGRLAEGSQPFYQKLLEAMTAIDERRVAGLLTE